VDGSRKVHPCDYRLLLPPLPPPPLLLLLLLPQ
jgi:hypothetical protein